MISFNEPPFISKSAGARYLLSALGILLFSAIISDVSINFDESYSIVGLKTNHGDDLQPPFQGLLILFLSNLFIGDANTVYGLGRPLQIMHIIVYWLCFERLASRTNDLRSILLCFILFCVNIPAISYLHNIGKDTTMALAALLCLSIFVCLRSTGRRIDLGFFTLFAVCLAGSLARSNAIIFFAPILMAATFLLTKKWVVSIGVFIAFLLMYVVVSSTLINLFVATNCCSLTPLAVVFLWDLVGISFFAGDVFIPETLIRSTDTNMKVFINEKFPHVSNIDLNPFVFLYNDKLKMLVSAWLETVLNNPIEYLQTRVAIFSHLVGLIDLQPGYDQFFGVAPKIFDGDFFVPSEGTKSWRWLYSLEGSFIFDLWPVHLFAFFVVLKSHLVSIRIAYTINTLFLATLFFLASSGTFRYVFGVWIVDWYLILLVLLDHFDKTVITQK
jgi:hypothetical protein